ncbi:uncharacterized protein [Magallana gigas]|uniref:uncharacterized protein isoform X2 n=1 Tax=Magallana gigas TaxID=29159 RepID=UPI003341222F
MGTIHGKEKPAEKPYPEYSSPGKIFEHQQIEDRKATSEPHGASNDAINFFRLACLLLDVCSDAMRDLLRCKISSKEDILTKTIAKHRQNFKTLHDSQKKILFPSNGFVKYHLLDFTMMYSIARNVCPDKIEPNPNNKTKWGKTPAPGDKSLLAAIETIRGCRNIFFAHATEAKLQDSKFEELWTDLEFAVNKIYESLGQFAVSTTYKADILNLKTMTMDQKSKNLLLQLTELERKWNDLIEMEVKTDLILEELMDMRKNFKKTLSENKEPGKTDDVNLGQTKSYLENSRKENNSFTET